MEQFGDVGKRRGVGFVAIRIPEFGNVGVGDSMGFLGNVGLEHIRRIWHSMGG